MIGGALLYNFPLDSKFEEFIKVDGQKRKIQAGEYVPCPKCGSAKTVYKKELSKVQMSVLVVFVMLIVGIIFWPILLLVILGPIFVAAFYKKPDSCYNCKDCKMVIKQEDLRDYIDVQPE